LELNEKKENIAIKQRNLIFKASKKRKEKKKELMNKEKKLLFYQKQREKLV